METTTLNCLTCNTEFDTDTHLPHLLPCGHNICQRYIQGNFDLGKIQCPKCFWKFSYQNIEKIVGNKKIIESGYRNEQKKAENDFKKINESYKEVMNELGESRKYTDIISDIIEVIKKENTKIENYFKEIFAYKT